MIHRIRPTNLAGPVAAALAVVSAAMVAASGPAAAATSRLSVPVDRQDYVTAATTTNPKDGSTIDPYDADPSSIHVAVSGGKEYAQSYVHLALNYLPAHSLATGAVMHMFVTQQSDASNTGVYPIYNVNTSAAIVEACVLTKTLPAQFDQSNPPPYDCAAGSSVGKPNKDASAFTFSLKDLLPYWRSHGNTGAALIPISATPDENWGVAFYKGRSAANVTYTVAKPVVRHAHRTRPAAPPAASTSTAGGGAPAPVGGSAPVPAGPLPVMTPAETAPAQAPSVAPSASASAQPAAALPPSGGGGNGWWPWVLAASIALALGSVGVAHRAALAAVAGRVVPPGLALWRAHPRAYSVASVALVWGLVFTSYSLVTSAPATRGPVLAGATGQPGTTGATSTAPGTPGTSGAAGNTASAGAGAATTGGGTTTSSGAAAAGGSAAGGAVSGGETSAARSEFTGKGSWQTINGIRVFFPADGSAPVAQLFSGANDTLGMLAKQIKVCAHAALTYGSAFHISASDLDVYWDWVRDHGGIFGRVVKTKYVNDNYDPGTAVQAAQTCKDWGTFFLEGGIGFDQIPAVRQWAEQNHMLYLHHIATIEGSQGLHYSFSALPTVEQMGTAFGELAVKQFRGKKIGILYRNSSNWTPGVSAFEKVVKAAGMQVVGSYGVTINQANYTQELTELRSAGAQVVFGWENALASTEMIKQAQGQDYNPAWLVFPFNLETNTLGNAASLQQPIWGVAAWDAYDPGYYGGGFTSYAAQIHEFEAEYKKYDPSADLTGDGGDLLFLNWEAQKWMASLLTACGPDCTRNRLAGVMLSGFHQDVPPNCPASFDHTADHHHAGYTFNVVHVVKDPNGRANFVPVERCATSA